MLKPMSLRLNISLKFKVFVLGCLYLISTQVMAQYKVYECDNERDTFTCNPFQCSEYYKKILPKSYIDFDISLNEKMIHKNTYLGGLFIKSKKLENCMIVDEKNWACISDDRVKEGMHNDIYYQNSPLKHQCAKLSFSFD
jgi:hypothetical protein